MTLFNPDPDNAPCERCGKTVHLQHDPPCDHGVVLCPECPPEFCEECA